MFKNINAASVGLNFGFTFGNRVDNNKQICRRHGTDCDDRKDLEKLVVRVFAASTKSGSSINKEKKTKVSVSSKDKRRPHRPQ